MAFKRDFLLGCDTGFGLRLAHHLNSLGFTIFAGCLSADREAAARLLSMIGKRRHIYLV